MTRLRRATFVLLIVYSCALAAIVFSPVPVDAPFRNQLITVILWLRQHGLPFVSYDGVESFSNMLLFVPFGFLAAVITQPRDWWAGIVLGAVASALIETVQWLFLDARYATLNDVVMNAIGTVLGVGLGLAVRASLHANERRRTPAPIVYELH